MKYPWYVNFAMFLFLLTASGCLVALIKLIWDTAAEDRKEK